MGEFRICFEIELTGFIDGFGCGEGGRHINQSLVMPLVEIKRLEEE